MVLRSVDACYERNGFVYSAFQRNEIVERTEKKIGKIERAFYKVIGHWKDYDKAREEVKVFNRKQHEQNTSRW